MKKRSLILLIVGLIITGTFMTSAIASNKNQGYDRPLYVPNQVIVAFNNGVNHSKALNIIKAHGGKVLDEIPQLNAFLVHVDNVNAFRNSIASEHGVKYVERNKYYYPAEDFYNPNDPWWEFQEELMSANNPLNLPKYIGISADRAWLTEKGYKRILVAVLDTGINYTDPDLDDHYVAKGYDWVNNDNDPMDDFGHGTEVTSVLCAEINNSLKMAGVAQVSYMAEKVLDSSGKGSSYWVAQAIIHATDEGAKIISMSLDGPYSELLENACQYAWNHGVLLLAAAGNTGQDESDNPLKGYPAKYDTVIGVGGSHGIESIGLFRHPNSSYGDYIEVVAPYSFITAIGLTGDRVSVSGTSFSTPIAAGTAALIWSYCPYLPNTHVRWILDHSTDDIPPAGWDNETGYGQVNATRALSLTDTADLDGDSWAGSVEWTIQHYVSSFDPSTQTPTCDLTVQAVSTAVNAYYQTDNPDDRQQILQDVTRLVNAYYAHGC